MGYAPPWTSPIQPSQTDGSARTTVARMVSVGTVDPPALTLCGAWKGLSPGRDAGYGKRAEKSDASPTPARRTPPLTPMTEGRTDGSPKPSAVRGAPSATSGMPMARTGTMRPTRSATPRMPDTTCSHTAVWSCAVSLCTLQPRKSAITGSGTRASTCASTSTMTSGMRSTSGSTGISTSVAR